MGIVPLTNENTTTDNHMNISVANPVASQKIINSLFLYVYSIAFAVNKLVKNTIAIGFEMARKNTEKKLQTRFVECICIIFEAPFVILRIIAIPNMISIIELIIPTIFLVLLFLNNFPRPSNTRTI